jgi:hypothetical protein
LTLRYDELVVERAYVADFVVEQSVVGRDQSRGGAH